MIPFPKYAGITCCRAHHTSSLSHQAKFADFKVQNMVGSCDVKFPIRLEGLVLTHNQFSRSVMG